MTEIAMMNGNNLDKLITISANNTNSITQIGEVLIKQNDELVTMRKEMSELKTWLVDNIHVDSADMKMIKRAVKAKVKEQVGYPSTKYRKAICQLYHDLEEHGKGSELGLTTKIAIPAIMDAIKNWQYRDYDD